MPGSDATLHFPQSVPLKVIGRRSELRSEMIAAVIQEHLGPSAGGSAPHHANTQGAYISYTFWITLPGPGAELSLRAALQKLPGVLMQL